MPSQGEIHRELPHKPRRGVIGGDVSLNLSASGVPAMREIERRNDAYCIGWGPGKIFIRIRKHEEGNYYASTIILFPIK